MSSLSIDDETNPGPIAEASGDSSAQDIGPALGSITISDGDVIGATLTVSVIGDAVAALDGGALPGGVDVSTLVAFGAISIGEPAPSDGNPQTVDWTYDPDVANLDWLGEGQTLTLSYTAEVSDGQGGTVQHDLIVTITGTNDAPTIDTATNPADIQEITGDSSAQDIAAVTGTISITDLDIGDTLTVSVTGDAVAALDGGLLPAGVNVDALIASGAISFDPLTSNGGQQTINWTYDPAQANLDWLAEGETLTLTFTAQVDDGQGNVGSQDLVVTITGTNDAPTIDTATNPADIQEITGDSSAQDIAAVTGTISITDLDIGDTLTVSVTGNAVAALDGGALPGGVDVSALVDSGAISFDPLTSNGGQQTINWTYDPAQANLDWLAEGETLTLTFTAQVDDGQGNVGSQDLVVTITGTNDAPTIDTATNPADIQEITGDSSAQDIAAVTGTISITDLDIGDTLTVSVTGNAVAALDGGALPGGVDVSALVDSGAISFDPLTSNGGQQTINWTYDPAQANLDWLAEGQTLTLTFTAQVDDGQGNVGSQDLVVTITGTNDAPVISTDPVTVGPNLSLTEAAEQTGGDLPGLSASGDLAFTDVDLSDTHLSSVVEVSAVWSGEGANTIPPDTLTALGDTATLVTSVSDDSTGDGAGTVHWAFSLPDHFADFLGVGETLTVSYDITVNDKKGGTDTQTVSVVITGTNDIPVAAADSLDVAEDGTSVIHPKVVTVSAADGVLGNDTDADLNDHLVVYAVAAGAAGVVSTANVGQAIAGTYGTLTLNADGSYSYSFLNTDAIIGGETKSDVFHYQVSDGQGGFSDTTLTINIAGTDLNVVMTPPPANPHDADPFFAQRGNDIVQGTADANVILGGAGNDFLSGGDGADTLNGGAGYDVLDGGADTDTADYSATTLGVTVTLSAISRSTDAVTSPDGAGPNPDTIGAMLLAAGLSATTPVGRADGAEIATDAILNIENVIGGSGADMITGDGNANVLAGGGGNDVLHGAGGADTLSGDGGNDFVDGGAGNDTILAGLTVGAGYDVYDGGADTDTVDYSTTTLGVTVALTAINRSADPVLNPDGAGPNPDTIGAMLTGVGLSTTTLVGRADGAEIATDALMGIENVIGGSGADTITGDGASNVIQGNGGADQISGGGGDDTIYGGDGNDTLSGGAGTDIIQGNVGSDTFLAGLTDGAGYDVYDGGADTDTLDYSTTLLGVTVDLTPLDRSALAIAGPGSLTTLGALLAAGGYAGTQAVGVASGAEIATDAILRVENVVGGSGADTITGDDGANILRGNGGADHLAGAGGDDVLYGGDAADTLSGGAGNDFVHGDAGNDIILGGLNDGAGNDIYDGGTETDTLDYSTTLLGVTVDLTPVDRSLQAIAGPGAATLGALLAAGGYAGAQPVGIATGAEINTDAILNVENVIGGSGADTITGDGNANVLAGAGGNDVLHGAGGADTLEGDAGNDLVDGGAGNDTILAGLTVGAGYDVYDGGADTDTVDYSTTTLGVTVALTATNRSADAVTSPDGAGPNPDTIGAMLTGEGLSATTLVGRADGAEIATDALMGIENVIGGSGADTITGDAAANTIQGNGGIDQVWGGGGDDTIYGGDGNDILVGGNGSTTIPSGNDTIFGGDGNDQLFGEDGNDILWGGAGSDQYAGGAGNDTLYFEGDGVSDTAWGGADSDTFVFQPGFGVDTIKDFLAVGTTADKIDLRAYTTLSFSALTITQVGNNVEITGLGAGNKIILEVVNAGALSANNFLMAVSSPINGTSANNTLTGTAGNDTINGLGGNDILAGLAGADTLDGGTGTDTATYAASAAGVNVSLVTGTGSGGDAEGDKLLNIENLTGSNFDDTLEGNAGANVLVGGANGAFGDTVSYAHAGSAVTVSLAVTSAQNTGGAGSDTLTGFENLTGSAFNDTLTGSTGNNVITGLDGNDTLNGGAGADTMIGGHGNDTYVVDNAGDIVDETGGDGTDLVQSSITFSLSDGSHAIGAIENLTLTGSTAINATGNSLDNGLTGNSGANILTGLDGNDTLNGGAGADTMIGGVGNDTYVVDNAGDIIDESTGTGIDTVQSSITFSLADLIHVKGDVENLTLTGSAAINATGNGLDNVISGNAGNNVLSGGGNTLAGDTVSYANATSGVTVSLAITAAQNTIGAGTDTLSGFENLTGSAFADHLTGDGGNNVITGGAGLDTLTGGAGNDAFVFNFANLGLDTITDFVSGSDFLQISAAGLGGGLTQQETVTLVQAADVGGIVGGNGGYFIFDNQGADSGTIYWDPSGGSSVDAVAIAKISGTTLSASDFHIV